MTPKINKISDNATTSRKSKTQHTPDNTTEEEEENDFGGFLEDEVKERRDALSRQVAILKKKQDLIDQCVQAEPCSSRSNLDTSIPTPAPFDQFDAPDLFMDFFEAIEEGDDSLRHYFEMFEDPIFNPDF